MGDSVIYRFQAGLKPSSRTSTPPQLDYFARLQVLQHDVSKRLTEFCDCG